MEMTRFHQRDNPGLETGVMTTPRLIWQRESNSRPFSVWGKCGEKHFLQGRGERQSETLKAL